MKKNLIIFILLVVSANSFAASQKSELAEKYKALNSITNKASLQRGAKYYVNYCSGCHSLKYMRMNTLANDLGIDQGIFSKNLIVSKTNDSTIPNVVKIATREAPIKNN